MGATVSGRLLAAFRFRLLVPSPTVISRSVFQLSSLTVRSELLAVTDAVGSST
jgi:hypothetical protein